MPRRTAPRRAPGPVPGRGRAAEAERLFLPRLGPMVVRELGRARRASSSTPATTWSHSVPVSCCRTARRRPVIRGARRHGTRWRREGRGVAASCSGASARGRGRGARRVDAPLDVRDGRLRAARVVARASHRRARRPGHRAPARPARRVHPLADGPRRFGERRRGRHSRRGGARPGPRRVRGRHRLPPRRSDDRPHGEPLAREHLRHEHPRHLDGDGGGPSALRAPHSGGRIGQGVRGPRHAPVPRGLRAPAQVPLRRVQGGDRHRGPQLLAHLRRARCRHPVRQPLWRRRPEPVPSRARGVPRRC